MGNPGTLGERCGGRSKGGVIRCFADEIVERASNVALVQLVVGSVSEFDGGARRASPGRTSGLEVDRLLDSKIVTLPQSEREYTHVERVDGPAGTTQDVVAQVIAPFGGRRAIRGISASVVLVASKIDEDNGGGVGDGEDLEGPIGQERAGQAERTTFIALDEGA